jgi:hypothetical protein
MTANNGGFDWSSDPQMALRMQLARGLMQGQQAPAQSWGEGLANMGSRLVGGYMAGQVMNEGRERDEAKAVTLANALRAGQGQAAETKSYGDGTTINWDERKGDPNAMAAILAGNKDTAQIGMQMQIGQMDTKAKNEAAMAREARAHQYAIDLERSKALDIGGDHKWWRPDAPGQTQAPAPAPQMTPAPQAAPQAGPVATAPPVPLTPTPTSGSGPMGPTSNNPGNIRTSDGNAWQGKTTRQGEAFESFDTPESGVRAMSVLLGNYAKQGVNTLGGIVSRWAPPNESQTSALVANAAKRTGLDPNQPLDLSDPAVRAKVVQALIVQEQGKMPYGQDVVQAGVSASMGGGAQPSDRPRPTDTAAPPQAPVSTRMTIGGQSGTVIGGQDGPAFRPLTPEERAQYGIPAGQAAQIDRKGNIKTLGKERGEGGGGPYGGPTLQAQDRNTVFTLEQKMLNGEKLTPQEQWRYETSKRALEAPHTFVGPDGITTSTPAPMPSMRRSPVPATDTAPNPLQPGVAAPPPAAVEPPAPPSNQPTITVVQKKTEKPSNEQNLNAGFANRLNASNNAMDELDRVGYDAPNLKDRVLDKVPGVNGYLTSNNFQKLEQAQRDFITAQLRRESGAAISPSEFEEAKKLYFPQPGEGPDIVARKRATREMAIRNMAQSAGSASLEFKPKPAPKEGDKPAAPTTIMRFDAEGNIIQ